MSSGTYLGFDYALSFVYFAVGFACAIWSVTIYVRRANHRTNPTRKPIVTITEEDEQDPVQTAKETEAPVGHAS